MYSYFQIYIHASCPVTGYHWRELSFTLSLSGTFPNWEDPLVPYLLHAEQSQLSQPLLLVQMLWLVLHLCGPSMDLFHKVHLFFWTGGTKIRPSTPRVGLVSAKNKKKNHFPLLATFFYMPIQPEKLSVTFAIQALWLAHGELGVLHDSKILFCRAALKLANPTQYQCLELLLPKCRGIWI